MVNGRRNNAPRNGAAAATIQQLSHKLNAQRISMYGAKTVPSPVPRPFVQIPWNSWTYESTAPVTDPAVFTDINYGSLIGDIRGRCGIASGTSIRVKVQAAQVWCTTTTALGYPSLEADFFEINGNTTNAASVRSTQTDKGTLNMPAKAGYIYPASDSKDVLNSGDANLVIVRAKGGAVGTTLTFRVQLLWQARA